MHTPLAAVSERLAKNIPDLSLNTFCFASYFINRWFCFHIVRLVKRVSRLWSEIVWAAFLFLSFVFPASDPPALKSPAAFHEQRRSLERARVSVLKYSHFPLLCLVLKVHGAKHLAYVTIQITEHFVIELCCQKIRCLKFSCLESSSSFLGMNCINQQGYSAPLAWLL